MATNAELRAAAEQADAELRDIYPREEIDLDAVRMMVSHILATVPADDDEPVTVASLRQQLADATKEIGRIRHDAEIAHEQRRLMERECDRLRADLLQQPPTYEYVVSFIGKPDKPGEAVSWWGSKYSWCHVYDEFRIGPYNNPIPLKTRAAVLEAVAATRDANDGK